MAKRNGQRTPSNTFSETFQESCLEFWGSKGAEMCSIKESVGLIKMVWSHWNNGSTTDSSLRATLWENVEQLKVLGCPSEGTIKGDMPYTYVIPWDEFFYWKKCLDIKTL